MNGSFSLKELLRYRKEDIKKITAAAFAAGILLMLLGSGTWFDEKKEPISSKEVMAEQSYDETERKLEEILGKVSGAGKVKVMITYSQSSEIIAAQEVRREESDEGGDLSSSYESTYVLKDKAEGGTEAVVLTEYMPLPLGVLIVAQGGDDIYVKQALSSAAQALLDVPAHKVEVLKMEG